MLLPTSNICAHIVNLTYLGKTSCNQSQEYVDSMLTCNRVTSDKNEFLDEVSPPLVFDNFVIAARVECLLGMGV